MTEVDASTGEPGNVVLIIDSHNTSKSGVSASSANNGEALVGFHEDALSQAAMGKAQLLLVFVLGLALAADCAEVKIINFMMPAAELHLCIEERRKGWLVSITLLAMAFGSFAWGILADYIGRRRALMLALTVATLFSSVAAVMPTYGTFVTARFGSGLGIAGAFPIVFSYLTETCSRSSRGKYTGLLHSMWPLGAAYIEFISAMTMPTLGADLVKDNREHWSSWHRFLLLSILPTIGCLVGLLWASESPRYLLEASREVEALAVYQRLHRLNKTKTQYGLTELELPGRSAYPDRPMSPTRSMFSQGLESVREVFQKIMSPIYFRTTLLLAMLHLICGFIYMGISSFSMTVMKEMREQQYLARKTFIQNQNFSGIYNETMENTFFKDCLFQDATFTHMNLVHVNFWNCSIHDSEFINVKTSKFSFESSVITNSRFIDTDLTDQNFVNCALINNTFLSLISNCAVDFDYNIYLNDLRREIEAGTVLMVPITILTGLALGAHILPRDKMANVLWSIIVPTSLGFLIFSYSFESFSVMTLTVQLQLSAALTVMTLIVLEAYPCHIRCSAHGLMRSLFHVASLCAIPIYNMLTDTNTTLLFPTLVTAFPCFIAALLCLKIQDNSMVLL